MKIISHQPIPFDTGYSYPVSKIRGRRIVTEADGASASELWEQYQEPGGIINPHYHNVEEVIVFLAGQATVTIADETHQVAAPCTLLVPPNIVHRIENTGDVDTHTLAFFAGINPKITWLEPLVLPDE